MSNVPDFFTKYHESPLEQAISYSPSYDAFSTTTIDVPYLPHADDDDAFQDIDYSSVPHAVTTPDDSAFPLTPSRMHAPAAELADVPEEDERTSVCYSRPSTPGSGLRHAKSFPSTRSNSQRFSLSPRKVNVKQLDSIMQLEDLSQSDTMLPLVGEPIDDIPVRPRWSRRVSYKPQGLDDCWEDDIDYCYEHAAEADGDFDWDRVSVREDEVDDDPRAARSLGMSRTHSISEEYETMCSPTSTLPRLRTSLIVPPLSCATSTKSPSMASLITPATPSYPLQDPQTYGLSHKSFLGSTEVLPLTPSFPGMANVPSTMSEEAYDNLFLNKPYSEEHYPFDALRYEPPASQDDSPRSSRSPISKCNSQESFLLSRPSSLRYPRSCDSFGSVPDLVPSQRSRDKLDLSVDQLADLAATIKAAEVSLELNNPRRQRSNQNLAKGAARNSMLQKASSFNSVEEEDHDDSEVVILPSPNHHERSRSAAVGQPLSSFAQRKRSATSATVLPKASRVSYSLFPPPSTRPSA